MWTCFGILQKTFVACPPDMQTMPCKTSVDVEAQLLGPTPHRFDLNRSWLRFHFVAAWSFGHGCFWCLRRTCWTQRAGTWEAWMFTSTWGIVGKIGWNRASLQTTGNSIDSTQRTRRIEMQSKFGIPELDGWRKKKYRIALATGRLLCFSCFSKKNQHSLLKRGYIWYNTGRKFHGFMLNRMVWRPGAADPL